MHEKSFACRPQMPRVRGQVGTLSTLRWQDLPGRGVRRLPRVGGLGQKPGRKLATPDGFRATRQAGNLATKRMPWRAQHTATDTAIHLPAGAYTMRPRLVRRTTANVRPDIDRTVQIYRKRYAVEPRRIAKWRGDRRGDAAVPPPPAGGYVMIWPVFKSCTTKRVGVSACAKSKNPLSSV